MGKPQETIRDFIADFVRAWPAGDPAPLGRYFSADAVYHNMPMEPIQGREAIVQALGAFMAMGETVDVEMPHVATDGDFVLTERVDYFTSGGKTIGLPVMGIFEVHDGVVTAWRDYFDLQQLMAQMEQTEEPC